MKVIARVVLKDESREFDIACGTGEKTFKWLANAACERFALAVPNGDLRRRDDTHGITDSVQYTPSSVTMPSGKIIPSTDIIRQHLSYGDEVIVNLMHNLGIDFDSGNPIRSAWNMNAYSVNKSSGTIEGSQETFEDSNILNHNVFIPQKGQDTDIQVRGKAEFMRLILNSQMLDTKRICCLLDDAWVTTMEAMPHLNETRKGGIELKKIFEHYFSTISDFMMIYSKNTPGLVTSEDFCLFLNDTGIFTVKDATSIGTNIHEKVSKALNKDSDQPEPIQLGGFLAALLICAQINYNDTCEKINSKLLTKSTAAMFPPENSIQSANALQELFQRKLLPHAVKNSEYTSILKETFCAEEMLYSLRYHHNELIRVFEKYIAMGYAKEASSSMKLEDFGTMLHEADLCHDINICKTMASDLFREVRKGIIIGRIILEPIDGKPLVYPYDPIPEDEFSYPEFVEAIARAGYYHFWNVNGRKTIGMTFMKGIENAVATIKRGQQQKVNL